jgi:hypothetical protein
VHWNIRPESKLTILKITEIAETVQQAAKKDLRGLCATSMHPCGSGFNLSFSTGVGSKPVFFST